MLAIVATPIGNLKDITLRAIENLRDADMILAEDTRRSGILLKHYDIQAKLVSYNDANKEKLTPKIIQELRDQKSVALISDNGTPGISDPGFYLVREAIKSNIQITPIPGPSASIAALTVSGLPTDKFSFIGFLPKKSGQREAVLKAMRGTTIAYESPHRIRKTLEAIERVIPGAQVCIARELTKKFEEVKRGKATQLIGDYKGEITLIIRN